LSHSATIATVPAPWGIRIIPPFKDWVRKRMGELVKNGLIGGAVIYFAWLGFAVVDIKDTVGNFKVSVGKMDTRLTLALKNTNKRLDRISKALPDQVSIAAGEAIHAPLSAAVITSEPINDNGNTYRVVGVLSPGTQSIFFGVYDVSSVTSYGRVKAALTDIAVADMSANSFFTMNDYGKKYGSGGVSASFVDTKKSMVLGSPADKVWSLLKGAGPVKEFEKTISPGPVNYNGLDSLIVQHEASFTSPK